LTRDWADIAVVATQSAWAAGLAALLVEINGVCAEARRSGREQLGLKDKRAFTKRYDVLVAMGLAANKEPAASATRSSGARSTSRRPLPTTRDRSSGS
jgi:hypothetical protein